jgi:thymidine kinase
MISNADINEEDLKIKIPSGMVISGSTSSGKTWLLIRLLENYKQMFTPVPKHILYCYGQIGEHVYKLQSMGVHCMEGAPTDAQIEKFEKPMLVIFDDLMTCVNEKYLSDIFCKKSHHQNFGVIFLTQNLFDRAIRVPRNNAQYLILTRSLNSMNAIQHWITAVPA